MFQVNFVDHDEPFFQLDNNPVYKLRCRLFDYASEELDTGIDTIDAIEDALSLNQLEYQFTLEQETEVGQSLSIDSELYTIDVNNVTTDTTIVSTDSASAGESIILENSADTGNAEYLLQEEARSLGDNTNDKTAQNELFDTLDDTVLDFTESNPFGDPT
jgi:hypothetical protein